ncbi:hypothetical protein N2603_37525 [Bradyrhizobium huanghuaihaiense]|uniref:hypothetical protein n=1 Tax=Bradyrhizobium huanghuaihaiense TaxID=990078 RepID=UPI0021A98AE1|nr:hypothetical protein [Bradyrhizobium sp. CB3035]UWU75647.1 hypothetical protein N2603_37525 [Bradyrhizobium sp. CB3035]
MNHSRRSDQTSRSAGQTENTSSKSRKEGDGTPNLGAHEAFVALIGFHRALSATNDEGPHEGNLGAWKEHNGNLWLFAAQEQNMANHLNVSVATIGDEVLDAQRLIAWLLTLRQSSNYRSLRVKVLRN